MTLLHCACPQLCVPAAQLAVVHLCYAATAAQKRAPSAEYTHPLGSSQLERCSSRAPAAAITHVQLNSVLLLLVLLLLLLRVPNCI
jgi:hypothetical protein